jgi:predicted NBD/HSP70 family sugar kinase
MTVRYTRPVTDSPPTTLATADHQPRETWLGVDIGGTSIKAAILGPHGVIATAASRRYSRPSSRELSKALRGLLDPRFCPDRPSGVGLCVPGAVDRERRTVTLSMNVPGLVGLPLDELLADALGERWSGRAEIVSDAFAAAYDFWRSNTPPLRGRLLALSCGTGVGACVLDEGVQRLVTEHSSGHLGQVDVSLNLPGEPTPIGPDGGRGSLEAYIGLPALRARYPRGVAAWLRRASPGDPPIQALVRAIRIAHAIYRPQHVVLLGGVGLELGRGEAARYLHEVIGRDLTRVARPDWTLQFAKSAHHAAAGAARIASERALQKHPLSPALSKTD